MTITRRAALAGTGLGSFVLPFAARRAMAQNPPIRLGCAAPLSGPAATSGNPVRIGAQVAVEAINKAGGVNGRPLELSVFDQRADPNQSVVAAHQFADQGIKLVLGEPNTNTALAIRPVVIEKKSILIVCGTPDERLTHEFYTPYMFTTAQNNFTALGSMARVLARNAPNITTWGGAFTDIAVGHGIWAVLTKMLPAAYLAETGKKITMQDPVLNKFGQTDFKQQISTLLASDAEALFTIILGSDGITFYQQARQLGLDRKIKFFADYSLDVELPRAMKNRLPPVLWSRSFYSAPAWDNPLARQLAAGYAEKTGDPHPHQLSCLGQTAVLAYAAAIKACGSTDVELVIKALEGLRFDTARGQAYFRAEDHQLISAMNILRYVGKEGEPGWEARDLTSEPDEKFVNRPTPGVKMEL